MCGYVRLSAGAQREEGSFPGAGGTDGYELPDVGLETQVLNALNQ